MRHVRIDVQVHRATRRHGVESGRSERLSGRLEPHDAHPERLKFLLHATAALGSLGLRDRHPGRCRQAGEDLRRLLLPEVHRQVGQLLAHRPVLGVGHQAVGDKHPQFRVRLLDHGAHLGGALLGIDADTRRYLDLHGTGKRGLLGCTGLLGHCTCLGDLLLKRRASGRTPAGSLDTGTHHRPCSLRLLLQLLGGLPLGLRSLQRCLGLDRLRPGKGGVEVLTEGKQALDLGGDVRTLVGQFPEVLAALRRVHPVQAVEGDRHLGLLRLVEVRGPVRPGLHRLGVLLSQGDLPVVLRAEGVCAVHESLAGRRRDHGSTAARTARHAADEGAVDALLQVVAQGGEGEGGL